MKTTKKQSSKFQLDTFEVAKIKNMKVIRGGDSGNHTIGDSTKNCLATVITK
jgi:hypothetical protein